ncbi:DoxX family protein [Promicromonospora aerolata]|uniref:DoxX family protein n=1 Tax=Promicromonospora aerolata TaxID=195749 RepID=A0ABW4VD82_9MICO
MDDVGLLLIRVVVGGLLAGHGVQKLFGWFGGGDPAETARQFGAMGYRGGRAMCVLAGLTELVAGLALATGTATAVAAAAVVGVMMNAAVAAHGSNGLWAQNGGYEYPLVTAVVATGIAVHGPGALSVDSVLRLPATGWAWGLGGAAVGVVAAIAVLASRERQIPSAQEGHEQAGMP